MHRAWLGVLVVAFAASGCAGWVPGRGERETSLRVTEVADRGDGPRRASSRLVLDGLDADDAGDPERALKSYELALQVDPTNPYAYIAVARHHADGIEPERAEPFLDQAHALLRVQGADSPRALALIDGIRGQALVASGRYEEGIPLLERARAQAPDAWSDGRLTASELR